MCFRKITMVFDGLGDLSGVLTLYYNKWTSTANIMSFAFPCLHQYCHLLLNGALGYWSTKIPTVVEILNKEIPINWPVDSDCTSMVNTKLCRKHFHLQDPHAQHINVSITDFSYTGHFSSHHLSHGGKL